MRLGRRAFLALLPLAACSSTEPVYLSENPPRTASTSAAPTRVVPTRTPAESVRGVPRRPTPRLVVPTPPAKDDGALQRIVAEFLGAQKGQYGVAVRDLQGPVAAAYDDSERFPLGSLYKPVLMAEVMRQIRAGAFKLTDQIKTATEYEFGEPRGGIPPGTRVTIEEALGAMISVSSNAAALALIDLVGAESLHAAPLRFGLRSTAIDVESVGAAGHYEIDGRGSARDIVELMVRLDREQLVGADQDRRMIDLLLRQQITDRLPLLLPEGLPVAHKTADLEGFTHDAGLVYLPGRPYALVVLAQGDNPTEGKAVVAEVSRLVYAYFSGA